VQGRHRSHHRSTEEKANYNTIILIVIVTIAFILLGMFSFTSKPQSDNGMPDGVDKYGRSTETQAQPQ
jgi:hypothetical protein